MVHNHTIVRLWHLETLITNLFEKTSKSYSSMICPSILWSNARFFLCKSEPEAPFLNPSPHCQKVNRFQQQQKHYIYIFFSFISPKYYLTENIMCNYNTKNLLHCKNICKKKGLLGAPIFKKKLKWTAGSIFTIFFQTFPTTLSWIKHLQEEHNKLKVCPFVCLLAMHPLFSYLTG